MEPFARRKISFHGLREVRGWRIKLYSVLYGPGPLDWDGLEAGLRLADDALPEPAITESRPGVGFLIAHQGVGIVTLTATWATVVDAAIVK